MSDLYPRPTREEIAARVGVPEMPPIPASHYCETGNCDVCGDGAGDVPDPLASFAVHLNARLRVLGWDQAQLQAKADISAHVAAKAINGTGCDLAVAGKIAGVVGGYLATMIGPYICSTCHGEPPPGFTCNECGEARSA